MIFVLLAFVDGKSSDAAQLFERVSQKIKVKLYNEALNDLNAAIEADPTLSEAYYHRASTLRLLCRCAFRILGFVSKVAAILRLFPVLEFSMHIFYVR